MRELREGVVLPAGRIRRAGGGSNGYRLRLWKLELQKLAYETGLEITVCHFPPGTSKWNKVEHRLFSFIASNWRGEPLRDYETIVSLIARTTTAKGLKVQCRLDRRKYATPNPIRQINGAACAISELQVEACFAVTFQAPAPAIGECRGCRR